MKDLIPIEHKDQRILLTNQLAEMYETTDRRISENFNANKDRYQEGIDYYALEGDAKREFLNHTEIADGSKNAKTLYLWTEHGALLHAKSLGTDRAWEVYGHLVDTYFRGCQQPQLMRYPKKSTSAGEVASLIAAVDRPMRAQKSPGWKRAAQAEKMLQYFGIPVISNFVEPNYEQMMITTTCKEVTTTLSFPTA